MDCSTENTSELGDTVLSKGKLYTYDGIELLNHVEGGGGLYVTFTIPPQELVAKLEDDKWTYFFADHATSHDSVLGTESVVAGLAISKRERGKIRLFGISPSAGGHTPRPYPQYRHMKIRAVDKPNFQQELIYNGRAGSFVKFLYRELSNDLMRVPFSQEVQYDLSDGNVIGFKGVRIEIISATNTQLTYKVLRSFPDIR